MKYVSLVNNINICVVVNIVLVYLNCSFLFSTGGFLLTIG